MTGQIPPLARVGVVCVKINSFPTLATSCTPKQSAVERAPPRRGMRAPIAWSLELGIDALRRSAPLLSRIPAGTRIYLPALLDDPPSAIEEALGLLARENSGLVPVPHIAAFREVSVASLESQMAAWQRVSSDRVREVLVVHGDQEAHGTATSTRAATTGGPFRTSLDLLETGVLQRCGVEVVHLCGHPEGIAAAGLSAEAAKAHLKTKLQWAEASGVRASVSTQFCFDSVTATSYVDSLRADGLTVDVSLGVVSPDVTMAVRQRMAARCGVAPPESAFVTPYLRRLAKWQSARGEAGAQTLHLYPFGGLRKCLAKMHSFTSDDSVHYAGGGRIGEARPTAVSYANFALTPPMPDTFAPDASSPDE